MTASATTGAAPRRWPCSTWWPRARSASCWGRGGSSATTSSSTWAAGVYAALAHLRRGSVRVRPGDRVAAGQPLAECGNSGNSSEPHLHFQLMDHPSVLLAAGLPLRFAAYRVGDADRAGVPRNLEPFTAPR